MVNLQAIGHLGKDAIVNQVGGKTVINFSVAHSDKFKKADGTEVNHTLWVECSYWTDSTKIASYLKKGTQVHVAGIPTLDSYKNQDNVTIAKLRLRIKDLTLLGSKKDDKLMESTAMPTPIEPGGEVDEHDDLPF